MQMITGQILVMNPAVLWLAAMVTWPVVLHLLTRRVTRVVEFPAVRFLLDAERKEGGRGRSRRWLMTVIRCLVVAAVVGAMAGLQWRSEVAGEDEKVAVVLVDASGSMRRMVNGKMIIDEAKYKAGELVEQLRRDGVNVFVVTVGKAGEVVDGVEAIQAGYESASWVGAMRLAERLLAETDGRGKVIAVTDGQMAGWKDVTGQRWRGIEVVEVVMVGQGGDKARNLAVSDVRVEQDWEDERVMVTATVRNDGEADIETSVAVEMNGLIVNKQITRFTAGKTEQVAIEIDRDGQRDTAVRVALGEDDLDIDNRAYAVAKGGERVTVGIVAGQADMATGGAGYYLAKAFAADGARFDVKRLTGNGELSDVDLLVVVGEGGVFEDEAVREFARDGGAVMLFAGSGGDEVDRLRIVEEFGDIDSELARAIERQTVERGSKSQLFKKLSESQEDGKVLLRYEDGQPAVTYWSVGQGSVFNIDFSVANVMGGLARSGVFVPLVYELAAQVMLDDGRDNAVWVGDRLRVAVNQRSNLNTRETAGVEVIDGWVLNEAGQAEFIAEGVSEPGIYRLLSGGKNLGLAAVNVDPNESDLKCHEQVQLQAYLDIVVGQVDGELPLAEGGEKRFIDHELKQWLLMSAIAGLLLELIWIAVSGGEVWPRIVSDAMLVVTVVVLSLLMVNNGRGENKVAKGSGMVGEDRWPTMLLDTSQSMMERVWQDVSRIEFAIERWLGDWRGAVYTFDEALHKNEGSLAAKGKRTRLGASLLQLLNEETGAGTGPDILVVSDGATDDEDVVMQAAALAKQRGQKLHTACIGEPKQEDDLSVTASMPWQVQVGDVVEVLVEVQSHGENDALLVVECDDIDDAVLEVWFDEDTKQQIVVPLMFSQGGYQEITVSLDGGADEKVRENNQQRLFVTVTEQPVRVLVIEGQPNRTSRDLVRALRVDERLAVDSIVQLRADRQVVMRTKEYENTQTITLEDYDVVLLGRGMDMQGLQGLTAGLGQYVLQGGHVVLTRGRPSDGGGDEMYWPVVFGDGEVRLKPGARVADGGESAVSSVVMPYGEGKTWLLDMTAMDARLLRVMVHQVVKGDGYQPTGTVNMLLSEGQIKVGEPVEIELSGVRDSEETVQMLAVDPQGSEREVVLKREGGLADVYRGEVAVDEAGVHRFVYEGEAVVERKIDVRADVHERLYAATNVELMAKVAAMTGGSSFANDEYARFAEVVGQEISQAGGVALEELEFSRLTSAQLWWMCAAICLWCCLAWSFRKGGVI